MMQKRTSEWLCTICLVLGIQSLQGQNIISEPTPSWNLKINLLSYASTTLNLETEFKLSRQMTMALAATYNPWEFSEEKKIKHFIFQPELRYWTCEAFDGFFMGFHGHWGQFDIGGIGFSDYMKEHRFDGWGAGAGVSVGYHWILSSRISIEATIGAGYTYLNYSTYPAEPEGEKIKDMKANFFGPSRLGVSLIYMLR